MTDSIHTVTVALFARDSVLLLHHNPDEYSGRGDAWELIGGHIHQDELAVQAAEREIAEETGIAHVSLELFRVYPFSVTPAYNWIYVARFEGVVSITLSKEHQAFHWTPIDLALQVPLACKHSQILRDIVEKGVL